MDAKIRAWIHEIHAYNKRLHLVSTAMEKTLASQVQDTMDLLKDISEPLICDLGAGSGFLGIPYKIMNPDYEVHLVERSMKKCIFLRHVIDQLGLKAIEVHDADPLKKVVGPFPAVMARSFSPRESLAQAVLSLLEQGGRFYSFSTGTPERITDPGLKEELLRSRECLGYTLNLDVYAATSP